MRHICIRNARLYLKLCRFGEVRFIWKATTALVASLNREHEMLRVRKNVGIFYANKCAFLSALVL